MLWGTGQVGRGHDNQRAHLEERQSNFPDQGQNLCPLHYRALTEYRVQSLNCCTFREVFVRFFEKPFRI